MGNFISEDISVDDMAKIAIAVYWIVDEFPICMINKKTRKGVRVERGQVIDEDYSGPVLTDALDQNTVVHDKPTDGPYKGVPVIASPLRNRAGEAVASIGVIDLRHAMGGPRGRF